MTNIGAFTWSRTHTHKDTLTTPTHLEPHEESDESENPAEEDHSNHREHDIVGGLDIHDNRPGLLRGLDVHSSVGLLLVARRLVAPALRGRVVGTTGVPRWGVWLSWGYRGGEKELLDNNTINSR